MISDSTEDFYENLDTLFTDFKLKDKKVVQFYVNSAIVVKSFDDTINFRRYTHMPDINCKKTP